MPYLIGERINQEKQVQLVSGVSKLAYWTATNISDFLEKKDKNKLNFVICIYVIKLKGQNLAKTFKKYLPNVYFYLKIRKIMLLVVF